MIRNQDMSVKSDKMSKSGAGFESEVKLAMQEKPDWFYRQSGVIPYRLAENGPEVLLVTSRRHKHWVIPKGIVEPQLSPRASASQEAWEEAGLHGCILPDSVGCFSYKKWGGVCRVEVFLMAVEELDDQWPEASMRTRKWFPLREAISRVKYGGLADLLGRLPTLLNCPERK